jgi:hypothetical protein
MRLFRVGGYNGPVTIYTESGEEIAHAGCRSSGIRPLAADRLFAYFQGVGSHPLYHS